jgi:hypothetical protein
MKKSVYLAGGISISYVIQGVGGVMILEPISSVMSNDNT